MKRKPRTRTPPIESDERPLLVSRKQAAYLLGYKDTSTIRRMQRDGILRTVRVNKHSPTSQSMIPYSDILKVIEEGVECADA